jgi:hypothetical protein
MVGNSETIHHRPSSGGLVHVQVRLTRLNKWVGPLCAVVCGAIVAIGFTRDTDAWLRLALLVLLVDGGWGTLWEALSGTDWSTPIEQWHAWNEELPITALPYTRFGAPGDRVMRWVGQFRLWWQSALWPSTGSAISSVVVAIPLIALLSIILGPRLMTLSIAAAAMMQLGLIWEGGRGNVIPEWDAMLAIALPWLAGQAAYGTVTMPSAGMAVCLAMAYGSAWRVKNPWGLAFHVFAQLMPLVLLILLPQPIAAAGYAVLLVPQFILLPWTKEQRLAGWYVSHSRWWLFATMILTAVAACGIA